MRARHRHYRPPVQTGIEGIDLFNTPLHPDELPSVERFSRELAEDIDRQILADFLPPTQPVDTSLAAAAKIQGHTPRLREAIYLYIRAQGARGATAGELEESLGISGSTVRPRLLELEGRAKWARVPGKPDLPRRIVRTELKRAGMRVYCALEKNR